MIAPEVQKRNNHGRSHASPQVCGSRRSSSPERVEFPSGCGSPPSGRCGIGWVSSSAGWLPRLLLFCHCRGYSWSSGRWGVVAERQAADAKVIRRRFPGVCSAGCFVCAVRHLSGSSFSDCFRGPWSDRCRFD